MLKTENGTTAITCDKCNKTEGYSESVANNIFFDNGWALNPRAKKYIHTCRNCQTKKQTKSHDFVAENFGHLL